MLQSCLESHPILFIILQLCLLIYILSNIYSRNKKESLKGKKAHVSSKLLKGVAISVLALLCLSTWATFYPRGQRVHTTEHRGYILPDLFNASILDLQIGLEGGHFTSLHLVKAYLARIEEVNSVLHAVIETAPVEILEAEADRLDREREVTGSRGYLHGIPILVKDNVATDVSLGLNTTAGSYALLNSIPPCDASIISKLRQAGAIILGKSNLSVWAQFRGTTTPGWSPRGGYTTSAYYPKGNACSSSSGAGVATSIGLSAANIGSETDGSILCPSTRNGVVGMKPTVGLASQFGIIPISSTQDTAGPLARSVEDAAIMLTGLVTPKTSHETQLDEAVSKQPRRIAKGIDYAGDLIKLAMHEKQRPLEGVRIGVVQHPILSNHKEYDEDIMSIYHDSLGQLRSGGATLINVSMPFAETRKRSNDINYDRFVVLSTEIQPAMSKYLSFLKHIPSGIFNLGGIIDFAYTHPQLELPEGDTDQCRFLNALYSPMYAPIDPNQPQKRKLNETYAAALHRGKEAEEEINHIIKTYRVEVIVGPTEGSLYSVAAKAGTPSITVPSGFLRSEGMQFDPKHKPIWPYPGAPAGLCFLASKWQEMILLKVARGFEVMQIRAGRGGYDGTIRTYKEATPKTQLKDVM